MTSSESNNYLYIGRNQTGAIGYVGIGGISRPYGNHNDEADQVLRNGEVWVTSIPFSTRQDAEMAESLLIRALDWSSEQTPQLTNIAKVNNSKYLIPALRYRNESVGYSEFRNTLFVKVRPGQLLGRIAPHGESGEIDLTMRCNRWWGLQSVRERGDEIRLLVAVTAGVKPARIIGAWETRPTTDWWYEDQGNQLQSSVTLPREEDHIWNRSAPLYELPAKGWVVTLESSNPDVNDLQGKKLILRATHFRTLDTVRT